ncbi:MAG TPA: hypothetical protein VGG36_01965 [Rhizomicrobium sp.]|jgi:catechol 2,3-dioxygenase-like lactoylglutathione lyase family enzyme
MDAPSALPPERIDVLGVDHIYLTVSDFAAAEAFYDTVLALWDSRKLDAERVEDWAFIKTSGIVWLPEGTWKALADPPPTPPASAVRRMRSHVG